MKTSILAFVIAGAVPPAFNAAAPPVRDLPVERASNVFFARTLLNGQGPFWFTVDTGATLTVIDPSVAATLRLKVEDEGQARNVGVGSSLTDLRIVRGVTIAVGDVPPLSPEKLYVVPVGANAGPLGHQVDGVLGTDFLRRFVVEFDYRGSRVRLHAPSGFAYRGRGTSVPITLEGNVLLARASVTLADGTTLGASLLIDTGSSARSSLNSPFVRRHTLTRFPALGLTASVGVNGVSSARVIALRALSLGQTVIEGPEVALSQTSAGLSASDAFDGIITGDLLNHFRLLVDYPAGRVIFERRPPGPES